MDPDKLKHAVTTCPASDRDTVRFEGDKWIEIPFADLKPGDVAYQTEENGRLWRCHGRPAFEVRSPPFEWTNYLVVFAYGIKPTEIPTVEDENVAVQA
jgi:hypothetical protein